ncbi:MAG: peptidase MA family metallohydrolase [Candidatus Omnitrophota bacterium]|nr:peptidase MA family metallohydrolase [Candidatus Omnitrophota bacterium]
MSVSACILAAAILASPVQAQGDKWQLSKSTHFIVYSAAAPEEFISKLLDYSEGYYTKIAEELGFTRFNFWLWDNRAKIYVYDNAADYRASTGKPEWSAGCVAQRDKIIYTFVNAEGFFGTTLPHELGHIIFREFVGFDNPAIPLWLDEGVASLLEKNKYSGADEIVKQALQDNESVSLDGLSRPDIRLPADMNNTQAQLFYAEAFSVVNFLFREYERDKFVLFCQSLRDNRNFERALASVYGLKNLQELDKKWQEYLSKPI